MYVSDTRRNWLTGLDYSGYKFMILGRPAYVARRMSNMRECLVLRCILLIIIGILRITLLLNIRRPSSCCRPYCTCEVHLMLECRLSLSLTGGLQRTPCTRLSRREMRDTPMVLYIDRWLFDKINRSNCAFGCTCAWITCWCDVVWLRSR